MRIFLILLGLVFILAGLIGNCSTNMAEEERVWNFNIEKCEKSGGKPVINRIGDGKNNMYCFKKELFVTY